MACCWLGLLLLAGTTSANSPGLRSRNLIIGGTSATPNRFPYYVALKDANKDIQCGGTLIAPDMVLTAAHCRGSNLMYADVGKYSKIDEEGFGEEIEILNPFEMISSGNWSTVRNLEKSNATILDGAGFMHPEHDLAARTYDIMLIKLARPASPGTPLVKVNMDSRVPRKQPGGKNEITIIGMGNTENTGLWPKPATLRQVHVDYLPYEDCVDVENYNLDYKFELLPHMLCTQGAGVYGDRGQCYGDSGGPYIITGNDYTEDTQVAVVSWAVNCASSLFPMVGSRTSESMGFIKEVACAVSSDPPRGLCLEENNSVDENMLSRYIPDGVKVSVRIYADPFGHELQWKITDFNNENLVYAEAPYGKIDGDHSFQDVIVPGGANLKFTIDDAADDGIFGDPDAILYEVVLVDQGGELIMVEGNGQFGTSREEVFRVPQLSKEYIAMVRSSKIDSKQVASAAGPTAPLKIYIDFADYHEDASWMITSLDDAVVYAFKNANEYRYGNEVTEVVDLAAGNYKFTIKDRRGTDEFRAFNSYRLSYLDRRQRSGLGGDTELFKSQGIFSGFESVTEFIIPVSATFDPNNPAAAQPTVIIEDTSFMEEAQLELGTLETEKVVPKPWEDSQEPATPTQVSQGNPWNDNPNSVVQSKIEPEPAKNCKLAPRYCTAHNQCCSGLCQRFKCTGEASALDQRDDYRMRGTTGEVQGGFNNGA